MPIYLKEYVMITVMCFWFDVKR